MDPETGESLDILTQLAHHQIQELGFKCATVPKIVDNKDKVVFTAIQKQLDKANEHATSGILKVSIPCWCPKGLDEYKHSKA